MSCIIGFPGTGTCSMRRSAASGPSTVYSMEFGLPQKYDAVWSSPVTGSALGCAENPCGRPPPKSVRATVSSSSVSSTGLAPASTSANVLPACPITFVLGDRSMPSVTGPPGSGTPSSLGTLPARTHRFRYHSARPSRRRTPWTMPSPVNQW